MRYRNRVVINKQKTTTRTLSGPKKVKTADKEKRKNGAK